MPQAGAGGLGCAGLEGRRELPTEEVVDKVPMLLSVYPNKQTGLVSLSHCQISRCSNNQHVGN